MKALVIGGGGREHALVWGLSKSKRIKKIFCCPGNGGISGVAECVNIDQNDFNALIDLVRTEWIDITVVGPEIPLSAGIVDAFIRSGHKIIGPTEKAARLEGSKVFAKDFMRAHLIPTAPYKVFTSHIHAREHIRLMGAPIVIKADGLAAGKGVIVADTVEEALSAIDLIMVKRAFGDAGNRILIEECLQGQEVSFMVFTDGRTIVPMPSSQDHKRILDGDRGANTGGMGAYSPTPILTPELQQLAIDKVMRPTIDGLARDGVKYKGFLYAGLMIVDGKPYVLEFNCRFGDPETQPIMMKLDSDFLEILLSLEEERLGDIEIKWKTGSTICVVIASSGYPGNYKKGHIITGLDDIEEDDNLAVFHAGTSYVDGNYVTAGGRVLGVTAYGDNIREARNKAYDAVNKIKFDGMYYRKDIGHMAITL
ncbi:MAG: phosphoribosylamine--glycine ligase [Nitrospirae bacterium]|nr:phosphoribosylamine--glycine ligase [Nitrospirota bacterium]